MNSSKKKKGRKNVVIRCRKISSTSNKSQLSFHHATPAVGYKRQIKTLLKNNKSLALSLEDTRCELTNTKKIMDEAFKNLNNMMFARFKILEMYADFKSFIKNFDEIILLLEVNDSKWNDVKNPSRNCRKWKNKMKKVVEEIVENHSMVDDEEIVERTGVSVETSSNENSNVCNTSTTCLTSNELSNGINEREVCHNVDMNDAEAEEISMDMLEEISTIETDNQRNSDYIETLTSTEAPDTSLEMTTQITQVSPQKACGGIITARTEEEKCVSPSIIDTGTSKISILQAFETITEEPSDLERNVFIKKAVPSKENISQILTSDASSSLKIQSSKIPKPKMKTSSGIFFRHIATSKRKSVKIGTVQSNLNVCKRKTFVIKNGSNYPESELPVVSDNTLSDQENFVDKNMANSEDLDKPACRRETFVIKPPVIPENINSSPRDRRKTFVKKTCDLVKTAAAIKNKRNTLTVAKHTSTLSKLNNNCLDQSENLNNVETVNIEKQVNLRINDITFEKGTSCTPMQPKNLVANSEQSQCNIQDCSDVNIPKKNHLEDFDDTSSFFVNISKEKEANSKIAEKIDYEDTELQNQATGDKLLTSVTDLPNDIENEDLVKNCSISKPVSSKFFSDSFESDLCQSIPDVDVFTFKETSPIKSPPIRRHISKSKTEKIFVFDANKLVPSKISIDDNASERSPNFSNQNIASCQPNLDSVNNIKMGNQEADNQKDELRKKTVKFMHCDQTNETRTFYNENLDSVNKNDLEKPLAHEKKLKNKSKKKFKCDDGEIDCIASVGTRSKSIESKNLNDVSCAAKINFDNLPVILDKNSLSENKKRRCSNENENNCNVKSQFYGNKSVSSNDKNKADECLKSKKSKRNLNVDNVIDDISPITSKRKKRECKKNVGKDAFETKTNKRGNKAGKEKKKSSYNKKDKNTFLVHAEVHPVPPSNKNMPTPVNNENEMQGLQNLQVSVVLNDIFGLENACNLNECEKEQLLHEGKSFPLKTVVSVIGQLPVDISHNDDKKAVCVTQDSGEGTSNRRRHEIISYREPSLRRKMRQF